MESVNVKVVYCRICGIKSKKSVKIFSRKGRGMGLEQKILKCLMLSVNRGDQLPTRVCFPCIDRLDDFSQFLLHVKQAQVKLRAILRSQGVHVKDERNNELLSTWKALLARQERESGNFVKGKKRKRKLEEKIYDSSDSSDSSTLDSVSDDSSSTSGEPNDASAGKHSMKKIAIDNNATSSMEFPLKNESPVVMCTSPKETPSRLQSPEKNVPNLQSFSSDFNSEDFKMGSGMPKALSAPSSSIRSDEPGEKDEEIPTTEDSITGLQGSSHSRHQPATTSSAINVTISPPIMFPAQASNSMIVVPGTNLKSQSGNVVPFYIWNVPKGGSPCEVTRPHFPQIAMKKHSSKVAMSGKQKMASEDLNSYALSKTFILPKVTANSTSPSETLSPLVLLGSSSNSLSSSKPSYIAQMAILSADDKPGVSALRSEIDHVNQGTIVEQSSQFETSVKAKLSFVNVSQTLPIQGNVLPSQESIVYSEQSNHNSSPSSCSENATQIDDNKSIKLLNEPAKVNESQLCLKNLKKVNHMTHNDPQLICDSRLGQHPSSFHEALRASLHENQSSSGNTLESVVPSSSIITSSGDRFEKFGESQESLIMENGHKTFRNTLSKKYDLLVRGNADSSHPAGALLSVEPKRLPGDNSFAASEEDSSTRCSGEEKEVDNLSTSTFMPVKPATPRRDPSSMSHKTGNTINEHSEMNESIPKSPKRLTQVPSILTNSNDTMALNFKIPSTNTKILEVVSKSPKTSGREREVGPHDLFDIPPLIPITGSLLKQYNNVDHEELSVDMTGSNSFQESEGDAASEALIMPELSYKELRNPRSCTKMASISAVKNNDGNMLARSDSNEKNSTSSSNPSEWISQASIVSDFTVNPDYSVVKCCLCSTDSYPFLITLASASDHCKFIHSEAIGSFGCIKCEFTTDQQQQIPEQLQSLHHHVSSGCRDSNTLGVMSSPQKGVDGENDVVEVKEEPVDVYEKALMNLKNSLRKVNMPRFRKLITSCKPTTADFDIQKSSTPLLNESDGVDQPVAEPRENFQIRGFSRNNLFTRKGSSYICLLCSKKYNSKHQVKNHLRRHKPHERENFFINRERMRDMEAPSTNIFTGNVTGKDKASRARGLAPKKMVFDIPPIKIEQDDSPQATVGTSNNYRLRNGVEMELNSDASVSNVIEKEPSSVRRNHSTSESDTVGGSDKNVLHAGSSSVKILFVKGKPDKLSLVDKVTHKVNLSDTFSFNPMPKGSLESQDQRYVNHSRHSRPKPIVKPLFKSPTINKNDASQSPVQTPSCSNADLPPTIKQPSPLIPYSDVKQYKKAAKKLSLNMLHQTSTPSPSPKESHVKEPMDKESVTPSANFTLQKPPHLQVRVNTNNMKVFRPKAVQKLKSNLTGGGSLSPISKSLLPQQLNTPSKTQDETMTLNGLVLKVPFIKLQRLNLLNVDPKFCGTSQSCADGSVEVIQPGASKSGTRLNTEEKVSGSSPGKLKQEPPEKTEESILGW